VNLIGKPLVSAVWWWNLADNASHRLDRWSRRRVPKRLSHWICNRFDGALGVNDDSDCEDE
jgi:hypothetical protein